jgi:hypothetical protein
MIDDYVVKHYEHVSNKSFEEVVSAFETAVGDGDDGEFSSTRRERVRFALRTICHPPSWLDCITTSWTTQPARSARKLSHVQRNSPEPGVNRMRHIVR